MIYIIKMSVGSVNKEKRMKVKFTLRDEKLSIQILLAIQDLCVRKKMKKEDEKKIRPYLSDIWIQKLTIFCRQFQTCLQETGRENLCNKILLWYFIIIIAMCVFLGGRGRCPSVQKTFSLGFNKGENQAEIIIWIEENENLMYFEHENA